MRMRIGSWRIHKVCSYVKITSRIWTNSIINRNKWQNYFIFLTNSVARGVLVICCYVGTNPAQLRWFRGWQVWMFWAHSNGSLDTTLINSWTFLTINQKITQIKVIVANFNLCDLLIHSEEGSAVDWSGIQWSVAVRLEGMDFADGISLLNYRSTQTYRHLKALQEDIQRQLEANNNPTNRFITQIG